MAETSLRVRLALMVIAAVQATGCLPGDVAPSQRRSQMRSPAEAVPDPEPEPDRSEPGLPVGSAGSGERLIRGATQAPAQSDGTGAFRTTCLFSHMRHDDPIVNPGEPGASHLHAFFGNTRAAADSTAESLRSAGNSTCRGGIANRTAYWVPALRDSAGTALVPLPAQIYYKSGYDGIAARDIVAFPAGLRMVAGDPEASAEQEVAHWTCDSAPAERSGSIPACAPGARLTMVVQFPQCWNGRDLDAPDHRGHMAVPDRGRCPASHPVAIPAVTFSIAYRVPAAGTRGLRLDSDAYDVAQPGGFSAHGDWFDAWDEALVDVWLARCINAGLDCHSHLLGDGRETYFTPTDSALADE